MATLIPKAIDLDDVFAREMEDPEFRAEWERLAAARAIADLVELNRMRKGLTQTALARLAGVSQPVIDRIESGEHSPTIETLIKLANALDVELMVGIAPASHKQPLISRSPKGATHSTEVTAALGAHLVVAAR